jgi:putative Mg2+ transporter-C (MgtC) family protein
MLPDFVQHFDVRLDEWAEAVGWPAQAVLRLGLAAVAGGLVGLERELRGRQAGFRTNLLVALGSAITMLVSIQFAVHRWTAQSLNQGVNINLDPARIAYGVMTGVGFLGAGAIVKGGGSVRGLTTAAGMWCVAAIVLACGFGLYTLAVVGAMMVVASLWILDYAEDALPKLRYRNVVIRREWRANCIGDTIRRFKEAGLDVVDASFERLREDLSRVDISLRIAFINKRQYYTFERQMEGETDIILLAAKEL